MDEHRNGKYFVAAYNYHNFNAVVDELNNYCHQGYTVKTLRNGLMQFAKIVYEIYENVRDPYTVHNITAVSGYNQNQISSVCDYYSYYDIDDPDKYHSLINEMYYYMQTDVFAKLKNRLNFCSVIWDSYREKIIAGVTEPKQDNEHLYYGYDINNTILYSNNRDILDKFCSKVYEMEENTYMIGDKIYNLDGIENEDGKMNNAFIKETRENADNLLKGINTMLFQITGDEVQKQIEENVEKFLQSEDPKKQISDYILSELSNDTKIEVLKIIKNSIEEMNLKNEVDEKITELLDAAVDEYKSKNIVPINNIITLNDVKKGETGGGFFHEKFEQILRQVQIDEPIMLIGPAGSGKNVAIKQVADALGLHMYYTNNASNEFKLTGFIDAGGNYRDTEFYKAFKNGGIFFLDEIDNSDPSALIVINSALANGYMAFPHETIERHKDFRIISAANTWGKGADLQYVGRNALDGATLDRFDNIFFDYDKKLEEALYPNYDVLNFMWSFRDAVYKTKTPHIVSTRGIGKVYKKEINNIPVSDILTSNVIKNLSQDDLNSLIGSMSNINSSNKYYQGIKTLRLSR